MKAELKRLHSPDIDLENYWPEEAECFGFFLQFFVGPEGEDSSDAFGVTVCTLEWLKLKKNGTTFFGKDHLIVPAYDPTALEAYLANFCGRCFGDTWQEVASKIARVARWEFDDYSE